jgi:hypothetical protein
VLFNFDNGPQYTGTPLDQIAGGVRARFTATGSGYSIQDTAQVIGLLPTGFSGLGLSPSSVYGSDLLVSFWNSAGTAPVCLNSASIMVAPQELACDSSSTMRMSAYNGSSLVGTNTAVGYSDQAYTWPTINLTFSSSTVFDNIVVHFESGPPTGGDWEGIFVADNLQVNAVPEAPSWLGLGSLALGLTAVCAKRRA